MKRRILLGIALLFVSGSAFARVGGGDIKMEAKDANPAVFSHQTHVGDKGFGCMECHAGLYTTKAQHKTITMDAMKKGQSCGACHNGTKAFDLDNCKKCHG